MISCFYDTAYWERLFSVVPKAFTIAPKVPEDITVAKWPTHARYGRRAGLENEHFLDADAFRRFFLQPLQPFSDQLGPVIFEFGTFNKQTVATPADFRDRLGPFLKALPTGPMYAVEIRNPDYLEPAYFDLLASHNVAHVFNAWTRARGLDEQTRIDDAYTSGHVVVRALLRKGRTYEAAVKTFEPYREIQEPNEGAREGLRLIANRARRRKAPAFLFVNNRLEGFAPGTIEAVAGQL